MDTKNAAPPELGLKPSANLGSAVRTDLEQNLAPTVWNENNWPYWAMWHYHTLGIHDGLDSGLDRGIHDGLDNRVDRGIDIGVEQPLDNGLDHGVEQPLDNGLDHGVDRGTTHHTAHSAPHDKKNTQPAQWISQTPETSLEPANTQTQETMPKPIVPTIDDMQILPKDKSTALNELREKLMLFTELPICHTAQNMVFSDGNPNSSIMLIGEAPGAEEDKQGKPFVGASGKLLDAMIASIGLDRTKVYITNVVPWRPPFNRQPSTQEIRAFLPFLQEHIYIIQPKVIVCVGGIAAKALLNLSQTLTETQAQVLSCHIPLQPQPIPAWTLYHPAYLMRAPGQKKAAWQQLLCIQAFLQENRIAIG